MTDFWQTSYVQRYMDNKRHDEALVRAHINAALENHNSEDDDPEAVFEIDVPDHLPNSPLCPKDLRHKHHGKGICPMHGRRKKGDPAIAKLHNARLEGPRSGSIASAPPRREPEIVYESSQPEGWRPEMVLM